MKNNSPIFCKKETGVGKKDKNKSINIFQLALLVDMDDVVSYTVKTSGGGGACVSCGRRYFTVS